MATKTAARNRRKAIEKTRLGRPARAGQAATVRLIFRLTPDEARRVEAAAGGQPRNEFARQCVLRAIGD
jgi:hypothetical protein